jgi:hypothetical protein
MFYCNPAPSQPMAISVISQVVRHLKWQSRAVDWPLRGGKNAQNNVYKNICKNTQGQTLRRFRKVLRNSPGDATDGFIYSLPGRWSKTSLKTPLVGTECTGNSGLPRYVLHQWVLAPCHNHHQRFMKKSFWKTPLDECDSSVNSTWGSCY